MSQNSPLDLSTIDPSIWRVLVGKTAYGPYTIGQLQSFVREGRLGPMSTIAEGDGAEIRRAKDVSRLAPTFAELFDTPVAPASPQSGDCNFLICADLALTSDFDFVRVLNTLGTFAEAMPGAYVLKSHLRLAEVQKCLDSALGRGDRVVIVNASDNRLGWIGLDIDAGQHLRTVWYDEDETDIAC